MAGVVALPPRPCLAEAIAAGQQQVVVVEVADDLAGGADAQEGVEDRCRQAVLDFLVGVLEDAVQQAITDQAGGEGNQQGQFAALGLVEQPGGEAGAQRVHL